MTGVIAICQRCGMRIHARPGDEHGPIVRLREHWTRFHPARLTVVPAPGVVYFTIPARSSA